MSYGSLGSESWLQRSEVALIGWWAVVSLGGDARARQFKVFLKLDEGMARPKKVWKWCQNWRALHILDGRVTLWRDLSRLEKWAAGNMEYNLGKHQVPPLAGRSLVVVQNGAHGLRTTLEAQWAARGTMSSTDSPILIPSWSVFREHTHTHVFAQTVYPTCGPNASVLPAAGIQTEELHRFASVLQLLVSYSNLTDDSNLKFTGIHNTF